ncbi:MAG: helix-turn-helix transcriptional regulator [Gemmatimonadetes bacterium]|nr:helix-turn-helix transcriptional regulator [Gemmatimonadota bacterium]
MPSPNYALFMKREPSLDVRERILDAAVRLIETCPKEFTMARVASEAGLSRSTVYRRFGSVAGLRSALCTARGAAASLDRSDNRARVLDAALTEFTRAGIHGATIQGIAERAGVSPMTVYNHFDDKEGLIFALISERGPRSLPFERFAALGTFEDTIAAFVTGVFQIVENQRDLFGLVIAPDRVTRQAFQRMRADQAEIPLVPMLEAAGLPPEIDARFAAACLMGMIMANAVIYPRLFGEEVGDPAALAEQITALFVKAVS